MKAIKKGMQPSSNVTSEKDQSKNEDKTEDNEEIKEVHLTGKVDMMSIQNGAAVIV